MARDDWSDNENDVLVADYFAMLTDDLAARSYSKAEHNRAMQLVIGRSRKAIEFKHQNVSAVLQAMGETWIPGYRPAVHFQASLIDAVVRRLARQPLQYPSIEAAGGTATLALAEAGALWIGPPPTHSNAPPPAKLDQMLAVARKFDVAGRDARNRALGKAGERRVLLHERATLVAARREDLADRVRWVADLDGDGAGYDIHSFEPDGATRLIEVKTTNGWERTPFHISRNELDVSEARSREWHLIRLYNFARTPSAYALRPPLSEHVSLLATSFEARLH
jgi:hypothetical protein